MHVPNLLRTMPEKDSYEMMEFEKTRTESAHYDDPSTMYDDPHRNTAERGLQLDEAADMYGDVETAEEHGYVTRGYDNKALSNCFAVLTIALASNRVTYNLSPLVEQSVQVCSSVSAEPLPQLDL